MSSRCERECFLVVPGVKKTTSILGILQFQPYIPTTTCTFVVFQKASDSNLHKWGTLSEQIFNFRDEMPLTSFIHLVPLCDLAMIKTPPGWEEIFKKEGSHKSASVYNRLSLHLRWRLRRSLEDKAMTVGVSQSLRHGQPLPKELTSTFYMCWGRSTPMISIY